MCQHIVSLQMEKGDPIQNKSAMNLTTTSQYLSKRKQSHHPHIVMFCDVLASIIHKLNRTTCGLDPFPTKLLMSHLSSIINIILRIVNLCFSSGDFPASCKLAIISPLIKKTGLDSEILKNYRPVANIIEKAIATQIHSHLINNDIVDNFQVCL